MAFALHGVDQRALVRLRGRFAHQTVERFGVRALNFDTGRNRGFAKAPSKTCPPAVLSDVVRPFLQPALDATPNYCENSFYAATEVGPNKTIYTGTFGGVTIYKQK